MSNDNGWGGQPPQPPDGPDGQQPGGYQSGQQPGSPAGPQGAQQPGQPPYGAAPQNQGYGQGQGYAPTQGYGPGGFVPSGMPPAPPPGVLPLRPLDVSDIMSASIGAFRRNPWASIGAVLLPSLVTLLVAGAAVGALFAGGVFDNLGSEDGAELTAGAVTTLLVTSIVAALILVVVSVASSATLVEIFTDTVMGRKARLGDCFRRGLRRVPALIGLALIAVVGYFAVVVAIMLVAMLLDAMHLHPAVIVLVVFFAVIALLCLAFRFVFSVAVVIVEKAGPLTGLRRSWKLMRGRWWRTLGLMLLVYLLVSAVSFAVEMIAGLFTGGSMSFTDSDDGSGVTSEQLGALLIGYLVAFLLMMVVSLVIQPFMSNWMVAVYLDARLRDENLGPQLMQSAGMTPADSGRNGYGQPPR